MCTKKPTNFNFMKEPTFCVTGMFRMFRQMLYLNTNWHKKWRQQAQRGSEKADGPPCRCVLSYCRERFILTTDWKKTT